MSIEVVAIQDDPWTITDDIEHIAPTSSTMNIEALNSLGNLTFLPISINRSIQNMPWDKKIEVYSLLSSPGKSSATMFSDSSPLPPGVVEYLANRQSNALTHLNLLSTNRIWGEQEIKSRNDQMLSKIFKTLYMEWLNP